MDLISPTWARHVDRTLKHFPAVHSERLVTPGAVETFFWRSPALGGFEVTAWDVEIALESTGNA